MANACCASRASSPEPQALIQRLRSEPLGPRSQEERGPGLIQKELDRVALLQGPSRLAWGSDLRHE